ncbi:XRE family transcriptional regulator [Candidatus Roizmanbacteria bacterium CG06_land_8_20_14_3_00_34_14]|uniref:XRE family transcriptional regulator n=2 Tax=Candidatus Roizmaniibacteriota TaxID=1752723 RepID=A0A2M7ATV7_9BACT|nr:MAG: XRE family transcriptional regulator [Candidatus Roizmanbacteria bacterium CG07_land_8_20_14_0_80_34_15]PIU74060.1 MAG: XRE family transcriptional regulator [Candidatus Roizmanbacteria bacterium CG06_land_8_20_14_3_00_34_14]
MVRGNFYYKRLGESILFYRKKLRLSQQQVATLSDVDRSYLAEIEEGKANPSVKFLHRIAKILKVKVGDLIKDL